MKTLLLAILIAGAYPLFAQHDPVKQTASASITLDKVLLLYGEFSGRTVLCHPALAKTTLAFTPTFTNRAEIFTSIKAALDKKEIVVIPDGEKFALMGLKSQAALLAPGATNLPATTTKPYPKGAIDFHNASMEQALNVYAAILGKKLDQTSLLPMPGEVILIQTCELTKEELLYAFETLIRWQGLKLVATEPGMIKPIPLSGEPKGKTTK